MDIRVQANGFTDFTGLAVGESFMVDPSVRRAFAIDSSPDKNMGTVTRKRNGGKVKGERRMVRRSKRKESYVAQASE